MSTSGECVVPFRGYSVAVSISVGEQADPTREAAMYAQREEEGRRYVRDNADRYARLYARFAAGVPGRKRFLGRLDRDRVDARDGDYRTRFEPPEDRGQIYLHLAKGTPDALCEKLLADFILSPAVKARLAEAGPDHVARGREKAYDECFQRWNWHELSLGLAHDVRFALANTAWLREQSKGPDSELTWKARALLCSIGEGRIGEPLWRPIAAIGDGDRWLRCHGMLLRIATDDEWPEVRTRVAQAYDNRGGWDSYVEEWWRPLLSAEA